MNRLGWIDAPEASRAQWPELAAFAAGVRQDGLTSMTSGLFLKFCSLMAMTISIMCRAVRFDCFSSLAKSQPVFSATT